LDLIFRLLSDSPITGANLLSLLFLGLARILPLFIYVPFLGANKLPTQVKVGFSLCIWAILFPKLLTSSTSPVGFDLWLVLLMAKEFLVGMVIGFLAAIPFQIITTSGMLIDNQRGTGSMAMQDPTQGTQSSSIGIMFNFVLIALFFSVGGPTAFIQAFVDSYDLIPPDGFLNFGFFQMNPFWVVVLQLFGKLLSLALQLAAPPFLAMLMTDLFLGIVNRLAPQVQISFLGMSLKSLVACLVLYVGWTLMARTALAETQVWMGTIPRIVKLMEQASSAPSGL
jgi:type III secretion protein SpaR/YscT/HrcT